MLFFISWAGIEKRSREQVKAAQEATQTLHTRSIVKWSHFSPKPQKGCLCLWFCCSSASLLQSAQSSSFFFFYSLIISVCVCVCRCGGERWVTLTFHHNTFPPRLAIIDVRMCVGWHFPVVDGAESWDFFGVLTFMNVCEHLWICVCVCLYSMDV